MNSLVRVCNLEIMFRGILMKANPSISFALASCAEPRVAAMTNLRLTSDPGGTIPTLVYSPTDIVYAFCDLTDASAHTRVEVKIRTLAAEGNLPDATIAEIESGEISRRYFSGPYGITLSYGPAWPTGLYQADYFLDGTYVGGIEFSIR